MEAIRDIMLPDAPALVAGPAGAVWLDRDGEIHALAADAVAPRLREGRPPILCHLPATARRLNRDPFPSLDVLELFAFARPGRFCVPTPRGVAVALGLEPPHDHEAEAIALIRITEALLAGLAESPDRKQAVAVAQAMQAGGWPWGHYVLAALGAPVDATPSAAWRGLEVWKRLPEWEDEAPPPPPGNKPVDPNDARRRLADLLGEHAEPRPSQADYASAVSQAFAPRDAAGAPHFVLAEAGTGVGKTLGYIAPASLWAEANGAPVWLSTYTRNLQHQIDGELDRLYPDAAIKEAQVVIRKGRENYLCLLNMEEAVRGVAVQRAHAVPLGLLARWVAADRDGDLTGGGFPAWLIEIAGWPRTLGLADRRGECIYSACTHYGKCFIEHGARRARRASLVIANHALVMVQAARGAHDPATRPTRYVFDEGHHVFDAADSAFSAALTGREAAELRRWLRGVEGRRRGRSRGLKARIEDLLFEDEQGLEALQAALQAAAALPAEGWGARLAEGRPAGATEAFLSAVRGQVYARASDPDSPFDIECETGDPVPGLIEAAAALDGALDRLAEPLKRLRRALADRLDAEAATLDTATRNRIEAAARTIEHRAGEALAAWRAMLAGLGREPGDDFVDWFQVDRAQDRDVDVGMHRHWVDPTQPFAKAVAGPAHGVTVTSATLTDGSGDIEADWAAAEARTGARHLTAPAIRVAVPSPFDYAAQTRVLVVTDVRKDDLGQVAAALRELFLAAGGGALGLFTAIGRLRAVHRRLAGALDDAGLPLYAQHVDQMSLPTLIDIFRAERDACLLGTDAVRDGVDVPGPALRLIVFDRVPWPRPTILHKARRARFGGRAYDDSITRLRLKQAFGRLVRRADDHGVFVLLDPMMPSRLAGAFPEGAQPRRVGLAEAVTEVGAFLSGPT
jgi:ATP-dependent DNA helicase DinG